YSILKPEGKLWTVPRKRHAPNVIAAILVALFVAGLGGYYGYHRWLEEPAAASDLSKRTADQLTTSAANVRHSKVDKARPSVADTKKVAVSATGEGRTTGSQKRITLRKDNGATTVRKAPGLPSQRP